MLHSESLRVIKKKLLDEVSREITNVVPTDPGADQAKFLKVTASCHPLITKRAKNGIQILIESTREVYAETAATIAAFREAEPVLMDFLERIPSPQEPILDVAFRRSITKEAQVSDYLSVQTPVFRLTTIKEQERVDE